MLQKDFLPLSRGKAALLNAWHAPNTETRNCAMSITWKSLAGRKTFDIKVYAYKGTVISSAEGKANYDNDKQDRPRQASRRTPLR